MFPRGVQRQDPLIHSEYELDFPSESIVFIYVIQIQIHIGTKHMVPNVFFLSLYFLLSNPLSFFPVNCKMK